MKRLHKPINARAPKPTAPRQLVLAFGAPQMWRMLAQDRQRAVVRLANLLIQAASVVPAGEDGDDRS